MSLTEEEKAILLSKISNFQEQGNKDEAVCLASDILNNDALDDWTPEQIVALNDQLKREAQKPDHSDYPEYEPIREMLNNLSDREKVLLSLYQALMSADNYGRDAGRYLRSIFDDIYNKYNIGYCHELLTQSQDKQLTDIARMVIVIEGLTV